MLGVGGDERLGGDVPHADSASFFGHGCCRLLWRCFDAKLCFRRGVVQDTHFIKDWQIFQVRYFRDSTLILDKISRVSSIFEDIVGVMLVKA